MLAVFSVLSTTAVSLRIFARWRMLHTFGLDDAFIILAQFLTLGAAVCEGLEAHYGLGKHQWTFKEENHVPYMKAFYASIVTYNIGLCVIKISILLQYRRIFVMTIIQRLIHVLLVLFGAWTLVLVFLLSLVCVPVAKFWNPTVEGHCLNELVIWYVVAGINLVTDFTVCLMPMPVISHLQLPLRQKMLLGGVFCLGLFTCIISIIRIPTLSTASKTQDGTWDNVDAAIWSFLELTIAILATCLPTLRPIFVKIMPRIFGNSSRGGPSNRPSGAGYDSRYPQPGTGRTTNGSTWLRSRVERSRRSVNSVLKNSDSTEELGVGPGWTNRSGNTEDDLGYGLHELGNCAEGPDAKNYTIVVSAGKPGPLSDLEAQDSAGFGHGIKATTMITQEVESDDSGERRMRGSR